MKPATCASRLSPCPRCRLPSARIRQALDRLERGDVRYRFVPDLADLD
ncbi:hypothetical protein OG271_28725 [Micromonospora rifamycinica]|nr:hypothetical protein [Micromonospora rifamycinica]